MTRITLRDALERFEELARQVADGSEPVIIEIDDQREIVLTTVSDLEKMPRNGSASGETISPPSTDDVLDDLEDFMTEYDDDFKRLAG